MRFRIRTATAGDVELLFSLERSVAEAPHWSREEYAALAGGDATGALTRCLLVAEAVEDAGTGSLAGFAVGKVIAMDTDSVGELESVVVAEDARRMGLGRALCEEIGKWCQDRGAREIELEVRSRNYSAKSLYASLGFVEEGLRRRYYRDPIDDAVLMRIHFEDVPDTAAPGE